MLKLIFYGSNNLLKFAKIINPCGIYLLKVDNRNTRTRREICSKLKVETPERRQWRRSSVFTVKSEHFHTLFSYFCWLWSCNCRWDRSRLFPRSQICFWAVLPKTVVLKSLHKKWKFSIKNFFSKFDQIRRKLRIWSHLLKKSLIENFMFCAVNLT